MCLSFLCCYWRNKKKSTAKVLTVAPMVFSQQMEQQSSDSLSSLRAELNSLGIPTEKEKYYQEIGGVLILKRASASVQNSVCLKEISIEIESPIKDRVKMARERLMTL
ncbi:unnamed protein product [Blepharisma stoltei]|uniref:Uncharacterized protein n=1 Tax=Blepharisma stoltei TaxID=1481888 RepID=A0AAU9J814_9CILI|nr:unnamed protein product [Blepharisma stoltei]